MFDLVSLFNGISTFVGYLKPLLLEELWCYYLTHSWKDKGVHTFPKGIYPKMNIIARLEYELAYYDSAVQRFNHYTTRTLPNKLFAVSYWKKALLLFVDPFFPLCQIKRLTLNTIYIGRHINEWLLKKTFPTVSVQTLLQYSFSWWSVTVIKVSNLYTKLFIWSWRKKVSNKKLMLRLRSLMSKKKKDSQ